MISGSGTLWQTHHPLKHWTDNQNFLYTFEYRTFFLFHEAAAHFFDFYAPFINVLTYLPTYLCGGLITGGNRAASASEVPLKLIKSDTEDVGGQSFSTDGTDSSLPDTAELMPDSCASDSEVLLRVDCSTEHSSEHCCTTQAEEHEDMLLELECNSEPQFITETASTFHSHNTYTGEKKLNCTIID